MGSSKSSITNISINIQLEPCYIYRSFGYYLVILWIVGTALNGSVLYVFIQNKKLRKSPTNILIGGAVLADFIAACFGTPLSAIGLLRCRWILGYVGCVLVSIIAYFAGCSNMYMLCLVSINRYFVVRQSFSVTAISIKQIYLMIFSVYTLALVWTLMPVIGWSKYDYEGNGASCSIKWEERSFNVISYNITIFMCVYFIPVIIIIFVNFKVLQEIRHHRSQMNLNFKRSYTQRQLLIEHRVSHTIIFIIGGFLLAWTPYAITVFIRIFIDEDLFPPIVATIPAMFAKTSVIWNPLIYIVRNGNFRPYLTFQSDVQRKKQRKIYERTRNFTHLPLQTREIYL